MLVRLENIHKAFASGFLMRRRAVLRGLDLSIEAGEAYALLGANGAGKSTTLRILLGLARPDQGRGHLLGKPLGDREARRHLGYLPESPTFHERLTADEFLRYCGALLGLRGAALSRRVDTLLEQVSLAQARKTWLRRLSKGMLQRLGLAQALLGEPDLLILDEPMSGLDPPGRKLVRDLILEQRQAGRTVLFSTHILGDAEMVCTRAGVLRDGRIEAELRLEDLSRLRSESVEVTLSGLRERDVRRLSVLARSTRSVGESQLFLVSPAETQELVHMALEAGATIEALVPRRPSLEDVYLDVVHQATAAPTAVASDAARASRSKVRP